MDLKKGLLMFSSSQTDRLQMKEMKNIASPPGVSSVHSQSTVSNSVEGHMGTQENF